MCEDELKYFNETKSRDKFIDNYSIEETKVKFLKSTYIKGDILKITRTDEAICIKNKDNNGVYTIIRSFGSIEAQEIFKDDLVILIGNLSEEDEE